MYSIKCMTSVYDYSTEKKIDRDSQTTLIIGRYNGETDYKLLLVSQKYSKGKEYQLLGNIDRLYKNSLTEGKSAISFKDPQHRLVISRAIFTELKLFVFIVNNLNVNKTPKFFKNNNYIANSDIIVPRDLYVKKINNVCTFRFQPPLEPTLEELEIIDCGLTTVMSKILSLKYLKSLHLSKNCICKVPKELGKMRLTTLILSDNKLEFGGFEFLEEPEIQGSLRHLDISENDMGYVPPAIVDLKHLSYLNLSYNILHKIPCCLRQLSELRVLDVSYNCLRSLPHSVGHMRLDRLIIKGNKFTPSDFFGIPTRTKRKYTIPSLKDLASVAVVSSPKRYWLTVRDVPKTVLDGMRMLSSCYCGRPTIPVLEMVGQRSLHFIHVGNVENDTSGSVSGRFHRCYEHLNEDPVF